MQDYNMMQLALFGNSIAKFGDSLTSTPVMSLIQENYHDSHEC